MSVSIENFVKAVYQLGEEQNAKVSSTSLAEKLAVSNAAITEMAKNLSKKGLVEYEKYRSVELTRSGRQKALAVIRRHRIWELFLHRILGMPWDEVHEEAEKLEHQTSEKLLQKLDAYLKYPEFDPHGDPIPDEEGRLPVRKNEILLTEADNGSYSIVRINASTASMVAFVKNNGLSIGQTIRVDNSLAGSSMTEIEINQRKIILNSEVSSLIYVIKNQ